MEKARKRWTRVRARGKNTLERYRTREKDRTPSKKTTICQVRFSKNRHTAPFSYRKHVWCQNYIQKTKKKERHNSGKTVNSQKSIRTLPIAVAAAAASVLRPRHRSTDLSIFTPQITPTHEAISTSRSHCPAEPERRRTNAYIHRQAHGGARRKIGHHRTPHRDGLPHRARR